MYLFHVLRSFLPLHNPIGFGASDFIEFALAALLVQLPATVMAPASVSVTALVILTLPKVIAAVGVITEAA